MPRKPSTKTTETPTEQMMNAIDTPINLEWVATAEKLSIPVPELQERQDLRNCHKQWCGYTAPRAKQLGDKHGNIRTFQLLN